jgi:hypothetical protein
MIDYFISALLFLIFFHAITPLLRWLPLMRHADTLTLLFR